MTAHRKKVFSFSLKENKIQLSLPQEVCCYCLEPSAGVFTVQKKETKKWRDPTNKYRMRCKAILLFPYCEKHLQEAKRYFKFFQIVRPLAVFLAILGGITTFGLVASAMDQLGIDGDSTLIFGIVLLIAIGAGYLFYHRLALPAAKAIGGRFLWPGESFRDTDPVGGTLGAKFRLSQGNVAGLVSLQIFFTNEGYTALMIKSGFGVTSVPPW